MEIENQYAIKINEQIAQMFDSDSDNHIDIADFEDSEKLKAFLHALSNMVPAMVFNKLTAQEKNFLEYNHFANTLCFEFLKQADSE